MANVVDLFGSERLSYDRQIPSSSVDSGGSPPHDSSMNERLARVEEAIVGLRHSQNLTLGGLAMLAAVVLGGLALVFDRVGTIEERVSALPAEISADLRDISRTLAESITAARAVEQRPLIIQLPSPTSPQPSPPQ